MTAKRTPKKAPARKKPSAVSRGGGPRAGSRSRAAKPEGPAPARRKPAVSKSAAAKLKSKPSRAIAGPKKELTQAGAAAKATKRTRPPRSKSSKQPTLNLQAFRQRLREKQADLLEAYLSTKGDSRTRESDGTEDYIDYAVSSYDREFLLSLTELEQNQLRLVEEALGRIDRGGFGLCTQCERGIPAKRLEVQPWARYCLRCQELADSGMTEETFELPADDEEFEPAEEEREGEIEVDDDVDDEEPDDGDRLIGG